MKFNIGDEVTFTHWGPEKYVLRGKIVEFASLSENIVEVKVKVKPKDTPVNHKGMNGVPYTFYMNNKEQNLQHVTKLHKALT
jgi:hypothetical protein